MDVLPIELIIEISSSNPIAFVRMIKADRRIYQYVFTPAGQNLFLLTCMEKRITYKSILTYSLITGKLHSFFDEPAIIYTDGEEHWYQDGVIHRIDRPAVIYANGRQNWHQHGLLHRIDGPAISYSNGRQEWYQRGLLHRIDGPAVIHPNGTVEWWIDGVKQLQLSIS